MIVKFNEIYFEIQTFDPKLVDLLYQIYYPFLLDSKSLRKFRFCELVYESKSDELIGYVTIFSKLKPFLDIALVPNVQNQGYGPKIIKYIMKYLKLDRILYTVNKSNLPSLKLLKKIDGGIFNEDKIHYYGYYRTTGVSKNHKEYLDEPIKEAKSKYEKWLKSEFSKHQNYIKELNMYLKEIKKKK